MRTEDIISYIDLDNLNLSFTKVPPENYYVYYSMIKNDTQISMLNTALQTMCSQKYAYIRLTGNYEDEKLNKFISKLPNINFVLENAISMIMYGASFFIKYFDYDKEDKLYYLKKLQLLQQASIANFEYAKKPPYDISKIKFYKLANNGSYELYDIETEKLWIVYNADDSFVNGESCLNSIYKLYKIKSLLLQLFPVSASKSAVYIPVAYVKGKLDSKRESVIDSILSKINASYNARAVVQKDLIENIDGLQDKRNPYPFQVYIDFLNKEMVKPILASYLSFGLDKTVPYDIQDMHKDISINFLDKYISKIINSYNTQILQPLLELNFGDKFKDVKYELVKLGIKFGDLVDSKALFNLAQYQLITPDEKIEDWIRQMLGLPERVAKKGIKMEEKVWR